MHTYSLFCALNFMLPAYRPNITEVACTTYKVEQAWLTLCDDVKMEAARSSRMVATTYQSTLCHIPEDLNLQKLIFLNTVHCVQCYMLFHAFSTNTGTETTRVS